MSIQDAFSTLSEQVVSQLDMGTTITLRRKTAGTLNTSTLSRPPTTADSTLSAVRSANRPAFMSTPGGGGAQIEEIDYLVKASDLAFIPDEGDEVIDRSESSACVRSITRVVVECQDTMYRLVTRDTRQKGE